MKNTQEFLERFNRWKNGELVYKAGLPVEAYDEDKNAEDPSLRAALEYALSLKLDEYNNGKDDVAGGYNFNAIKQISLNAPLSYGPYYDLTGDYKMDNRLPKYNKGTDPAEKLYKKLRSLGFDRNSAIGIVANARLESNLNPDSVSASKNYHGLLLNSTSIKNAILGYYGKYDEDTLLLYVVDWAKGKKHITKGKYAPALGTYSGKYKMTGYKTPEEATDAFLKYYERAVILNKAGKVIGYLDQDKRKNYATLYSKKFPVVQAPPITYPERVGTNYDYDRAVELGYGRDKTGHMPSRDYKTGRILKNPSHPTMPITLVNDAQVGYYPHELAGLIYTNTWKGNEFLTGIFQMYDQINSANQPMIFKTE